MGSAHDAVTLFLTLYMVPWAILSLENVPIFFLLFAASL